MDLQWTRPTEDGGAEITNYKIDYRVQGTTKWNTLQSEDSIPEPQHTMTNLQDDTYYEFRVAAENKAGTGPYSDPSQPMKTLIGAWITVDKSVL